MKFVHILSSPSIFLAHQPLEALVIFGSLEAYGEDFDKSEVVVGVGGKRARIGIICLGGNENIFPIKSNHK